MYIYGKNVVKEKIQSGEKVNKAYVSERFNDKDIISLLKHNHIKYTFVPDKFLNDKVDGMHQGIVLDVDDVKTYELDYILNLKKENPIVVMLDHLEDPHNFGAIIRTCEALGIDAIIIPNDRSVNINGTVVKTSVGAIYNIPIVRVVNLNNCIRDLKKNGYWIYGTDMDGEDYNSLDYNNPVCLIIGNEGSGMSKVVRDNCDFIASIPMGGKINSLNASVSAGIILSRIVLR
ncbi:MAG: 23S rRNA (guanosine(2251)-2'-O)-methyltransferase RlmB [Bacilli bacterium]|nr:23S rRNA (guanosine(2251)-2'-O)-methyltransferase RlmB [Bacilli bacterium]